MRVRYCKDEKKLFSFYEVHMGVTSFDGYVVVYFKKIDYSYYQLNIIALIFIFIKIF